MQDPILKRIFAIPGMIELLARRCRPGLASTVDFATLAELPNELLSEKHDKRVPDMLFIADCRGGDRRVLFHIEFQAASDAEMPLRNLVYAGLAAQKLRKRFRDRGESVELAVVSMVLYHGADPWRVPATVEELIPGITRFELVRPEAVEPGAARAEDVPVLVLGLLVPRQTPAEQRRRIDALRRALEPAADPRLLERLGRELRPVLVSTYEDSLLKEAVSMPTMIEIFAEVRDAGLASARAEGRLEGRSEGRLEGRSEGRLEGRTRMIRMIVRQARRRFGPETARRLSGLLSGADDPDRLEGVAEAVIDCDGGGEFLDRVGALLRADQS